MLKPVAMQKIRVAGVRDRMAGVISALHDLGAVEFAPLRVGNLAGEKPAEEYTRMAEELVRLKGIESALPSRRPVPARPLLAPGPLIAAAERVKIDARLSHIRDRLAEIVTERSEFSQALILLEGLDGLDVDLSLMQSTAACMFVGLIPTGKVASLDEALRARTDRYVLRHRHASKLESVVALVADGKKRDDVAAALQRSGFTEVRLPAACGTADNPLAELSAELNELDAEKFALEKELDLLADASFAEVASLRGMLEIQCDRAYAPSRFSRTEHAFVFDAWLPEGRFAEVAGLLKKNFGGDVGVQRVSDGELPPTLLHNPAALGPFQFMVEFISLPSAHDLDPTILFALIFPLIYGMMLGDVGYGLASLAVAFIVVRRFRGTLLEPIAKIWMYASIPTIAFGILFNEYFGFTLAHLLGYLGASPAQLPAFVSYGGLARMDNIALLLLITIFIGAFHIALGFLLGAYKGWHEGNVKHAAAKLSWLVVEASGFVLVAAGLFRALPDAVLLPAGGAMLGALAVIVWGEGPMGLIEVPGLMGNILSYARIAAAGVASVIVAELINELLLPRPEQGLLFFVLIPIYLGLHLFNIVLGMFESLIQGARLNYVEFFSKFYEGGGRQFAPFSVRADSKKGVMT